MIKSLNYLYFIIQEAFNDRLIRLIIIVEFKKKKITLRIIEAPSCNFTDPCQVSITDNDFLHESWFMSSLNMQLLGAH